MEQNTQTPEESRPENVTSESATPEDTTSEPADPAKVAKQSMGDRARVVVHQFTLKLKAFGARLRKKKGPKEKPGAKPVAVATPPLFRGATPFGKMIGVWFVVSSALLVLSTVQLGRVVYRAWSGRGPLATLRGSGGDHGELSVNGDKSEGQVSGEHGNGAGNENGEGLERGVERFFGQQKALQAAAASLVSLDRFSASLQSQAGNVRVFEADIYIECDSPETATRAKARLDEVREAVSVALQGQGYEKLLTEAGKADLRLRLKDAVEASFRKAGHEGKIKRVLLTSLIME